MLVRTTRLTVRGLAAALLLLGTLASRPASAQQDVDDDVFDDDDRDAPQAVAPSVNAGIHVGGMIFSEMAGLNRRLALAGLPELSSLTMVVEPTVRMHIGRVVVPLTGRLASVAERQGTKLDVGGILLGLGYDVLGCRDLALFPTLSFGIMNSQLSVGLARGLPATAGFDGILGAAAGPVDMARLTLVGEVGLGFDWTFMRVRGELSRGLYLGARVSMTAAFADSSWIVGGTGEQRVVAADGPNAPVSGPLAALALGVRL